MSDPLEERFRDFTTGTPAMSPASPAEIRDRGDRLRRRRTALTVAGAALAIAVVATPIAVLAGGDDDAGQEPAGTPTATDTVPPDATLVAEIPEDFPLTPAGWTTTDQAQVPAGRLDACDQRPQAARALDRVTRELSSPVTLDSRELLLFADGTGAVDYTGSLVGVFERCPEPDPGVSLAVTPGDLGEDSFTVTVGGNGAGLVTVIQVVRVGNLVLVDYSLEEGDDPSGLAAASRSESEPVVAAMEELAGQPPEPSSPPLLLDSFLPAAGDLPTRDRLTAWEEVETTDERLVGCQPDVGVGADEVIQRSFAARIAPTGGLPAGEDVAAEVRVSVLQYGSEADAEAAEAAVTGWIRDCDDPAGSALDGATRQGGLVDTEAGTYATWIYAATEICTDCDAAWFERMSVLADQGRMVVVSFRELGGPLEPEGLDATMRDLMLQAAGRSMPG